MPDLWEPLNRNTFAPFGDVIEMDAGETVSINDGTTIRHTDLAAIDVTDNDGRPVVSIFDSRPFDFPLTVKLMERHPKGSQAFIPMEPKPYYVVVAPRGETVRRSDLRVFLARGDQGVNYARGVWHHAAIVIEPMRFLVIDRGIAEPNCDFLSLSGGEPPLVLGRPG